MSDCISIGSGGLFEEPEDFVGKEPESHFANYKRELTTNENIKLRLVGKSPLWGHLLWNAGIYTANYIEKNIDEIKNKIVVEFGAASALPSILCGLNKAKKVICTDYPDPTLLENIQFNIDANGVGDIVKTEGFIWGNTVEEIQLQMGEEFADFIIMSDLVFNHSEHSKLLKSAKELIKPGVNRQGGKCLVVWSPHRPKQEMVDNDFSFFDRAKEEFGFDVEFIEMVHWEHPMFPDDPKDTEELRKRVYCYILHANW